MRGLDGGCRRGVHRRVAGCGRQLLTILTMPLVDAKR